MDDLKIKCRACGIERPLSLYRFFDAPRQLYMDFCSDCEQNTGTITLYRRFNAYGTKEIIEAVFAAERTPKAKRTDDQARLLVEPSKVREPRTNEELLQKELARRELARRRLIYFARTFQHDYMPSWVHQDICRKLEAFVEAVERGESPRLMIAMPPRHGKSLLASDIFPSWVLGMHPNWGIIGASYAITLPTDFSRNIRDRLKDPEYQAIFPDTKLRADSQGVEAWKTSKGGGYIAAGVGTGINGKGMHIGIGDDLIKDHEAAQSDVIRAAAYSWYQSVFRTRLAPGGGIVLIGTRWHDADVQGQILTKEEELRKAGVPEWELEDWELINYPAIADNDEFLLSNGKIWSGTPPEDDAEPRLLRKKGEALHPERYPVNELMKLKHTFTPMIWSALYQQNPTPDDGEFFKRSDLRWQYLPRDQYPSCRVFITFDLAISTKTRNDFTVGGAFALDSNKNLYVLEIIRGRWGTHELVKRISDFVEKYNPEVYAGERGAIYEAIWPLVRAELARRNKYISIDETLVPIVDKEVRARPLQGRAQMHTLFFSQDPTSPDMYDEAVRELLRFPNGRHDDIVDMLAWGARLASTLSPPARRTLKSTAGNGGYGSLMPTSDVSHMAA